MFSFLLVYSAVQWVLDGSRQQLRSHVISLGPYGLTCQRSLRWRVVMKDREESSIECLRLRVRIRYSLYRISFISTSPHPNDPSQNTHTHTFFVCVYMSLLLIGLVKHLDMSIQYVLIRCDATSVQWQAICLTTLHKTAAWCNTVTSRRCV